MTVKNIGIRLLHDRKNNKWFQNVMLCTFYGGKKVSFYNLTRHSRPISQEEVQILFKELDIKEYLSRDHLSWYGCEIIRTAWGIEHQ